MGTAVGDLVYALILDDAQWKTGISRSVQGSRELKEGVTQNSEGSLKAVKWLANSFYEAGASASAFSSTAGMALESVGGSIDTVFTAAEGVEKLGKAYKWAAAQQAITSLAAGPWAALGGAALLAGGAYYYFSGSSEKVTAAMKENASEIDKLIEKYRELEASRKDNKASLLPTGPARDEFNQRNDNLKGAERQLGITREQIAANQELMDKLYKPGIEGQEFYKNPDISIDEYNKYQDAKRKQEELANREQRDVGNVEFWKEAESIQADREAATSAEEKYNQAKQDQVRAFEEVRDKMWDENQAFGESAAMKEKMALANSHLYTPEQLAILGGIIDENERLTKIEEDKKKSFEDQLSVMQEAQQLTESLQTSTEKYYNELARIEELGATGLLDEETINRANLKAYEEWLNSAPEKKKATTAAKSSEGPKALEAGSQEAWQYIVAAMNPNKDELQKDIAEATKRTADGIDQLANREVEEVGLPV